MKHLFFSLLVIWLCANLPAQEFDVRFFEADPADLAARRYEKLTVNDEPAALIKVITNISGMIFDSNLGIVDVEHKEAEYWVYVPPRERRIRLMAPEFLAMDVSLPEPARSHNVYHLVVTHKGMLAPITDLVRLTFRFNERDVFIRRGDQAPVSTIGNIALFNIEKGEHSFRFIKEGFAEKTLTLDVGDDDEVFVELIPGQVTTPFEPPGIIVVNAEQSGTEVYLNEQRVGVTPYQNTHISGVYSLLLRHTDYHDHYQTFSLEAGATMTIPTVNLVPRYGFYEVASTPSGADVLLNNSLIGRTPLPKTQISSEYHELTVRYSMYHDHTETFTIEDGDHKRFDIELKPAFGGLRITSEPMGARVFIAGREVGTTPYQNLQKPSGRYNVRLSRDLYGDATETILVSDGETTERFIPLAQNFGSLEVQAADADIYIDDERVGRGSHTADLIPGKYLLKATRPQHHDDEREVFIRLGQTERITLSPTPKTGYVSITSEPFEANGAEIWIDGVKQQQVTPAVIPLLEGSYEVRLKKAGFADAVGQVEVLQNDTSYSSFTMLSGKRVTISSVPLGADVYLNDELVGRTPIVKELHFGNHRLKLINKTRVINEYLQVKQNGENLFEFNVREWVTDIDSNTYRTVIIGEQEWMAENLKTTRYRNGVSIHKGLENNTNGAYDWYPKDVRNNNNHGISYNWYAVNNPNGLCPKGWHVPSKSEWRQLVRYLKRNVRDNSKITIGNVLASPRYGEFSIMPSIDDKYWSSTELRIMKNTAHYFLISKERRGKVYIFNFPKSVGFSVRCVRDYVSAEDY